MRALHSQALLLPFFLLFAADAPTAQVQDQPDTMLAEAGAPEESSAQTTPLERARKLTTNWKEARYAILNARVNLGEYHQKNVLHELPDGRAILEFKDSIRLYRNDDPVEYRTECAVSEEFELISVSGRFGVMGSASVRFSDGKAVGENSNSGTFDMETPEHLISSMTLLRGLRQQALVKDEPVEWDTFAIEGAPKPVAVQQVTLTFMGEEEVMAQEVMYTGKKYKLKASQRKPVFYWFGTDGQLLKVQENRQIWELLPPGATKALKVKPKKRGKRNGADGPVEKRSD